MKLLRGMIRSLKAVVDLLLPRTCIACEKALLLEEEHLCSDCLADLPLTRFHLLRHSPMAYRFSAIIQEYLEPIWTAGNAAHERYAYATALFFYDGQGDYRHIQHRLKYQGDIRIGQYFGKMLGSRLAGAVHFTDIDMVIPVPLHWTRQWKRGYNQAEVIASALAREMDVPMRTDILMRSRRTRTQTKLDIEGKARNVAGAFAVSEDAAAGFRNGAVPRHIVLVDDVFTTGSTLGACFKALRSVFPPQVRISVATLAFVGGA